MRQNGRSFLKKGDSSSYAFFKYGVEYDAFMYLVFRKGI